MTTAVYGGFTPSSGSDLSEEPSSDKRVHGSCLYTEENIRIKIRLNAHFLPSVPTVFVSLEWQKTNRPIKHITLGQIMQGRQSPNSMSSHVVPPAAAGYTTYIETFLGSKESPITRHNVSVTTFQHERPITSLRTLSERHRKRECHGQSPQTSTPGNEKGASCNAWEYTR